ncbi:T9SS type A sorting domain-containing protein [Neolewinella persica]|uniref:T9SS type A sorting domain-containing protein n=1 Tax=Neolewinella persica TaxID=70998 RepID=UPI000A06AEC3|nr:T9SS type A sorting domain-containing protein [Neolewinella persica]
MSITKWFEKLHGAVRLATLLLSRQLHPKPLPFGYSFLLCVLLLCSIKSFGQINANCNDSSSPKVLLVGDSWAQYMGDDGRYDELFNDYGFPDHYLVTETLGSSPGPGYTGSAYAVSGSEAREWANTASYPYIANMVVALQSNPSINTVVLSIGGNDILAAKSGGGWYKDMELDVPGSEQALFDVIKANTLTIVNAALAVRPDIEVLISSYEYPNFNTGFLCFVYACPKRDDLSRDPANDLITDAELNGMMLTVEAQRQNMVGEEDRLFYDNSIGLMHHVYGDGVTAPGVLPKPEGTAPYTPGGNPARPSLRGNFRNIADPIHLDADGYEYKIQNQLDNYLFDRFRESPDATFFSEGGNLDGWVDVITNNVNTGGIRMGDDGASGSAPSNDWRGILSFDTGNLPSNAMITGARIYLTRSSQGGGANPYSLSDRNPRLDIKSGTFGSASVEPGDGNATASADDVGCFHGDVAENLDVTRIDIDPAYLTHINTGGRTQFRLMFDVADQSANYVNYYDGSEVGQRSDGTIVSDDELDNTIIYQEKTVEIEDEDGMATEMTVDIPAKAPRGLQEALGTTAPFLDLTFELNLPVELIQFTAMADQKYSLLQWATSIEEDFAGFHVERSGDGSTWQEIGFVAGHGQTQRRQDYQFVDPFPLNGENYYRLNMLDQDDSQAYSEIRQLNYQQIVETGRVYPNPFTNELKIQIGENYTNEVHIQLYDLLGRSLQKWHFDQLNSGVHELNVDAALPTGTYWLEVISADKHTSTQLIKR